MEKLNRKGVAAHLAVTSETVRNWISAGLLVPDENDLIDTEQLEQLDLSKYEDSKQWVSIQKACQILDVTRATIFNYCAAKVLERATLRGRSYVSLDSIQAVLLSKKEEIETKIQNLQLEMETV